ncbi:hypothetical protein Fleli_0434 [Bernardetia litoralis DSM 6794]|uniref:Outer membrane protein beta-barrel domain-containing protein n=1 Tax=Bernardetia litoralis (strain ATCC 23117 / DSM 6794 / NBRC 15988 / NCIMB 1366 / Fx l1 / Sio-4) TaxID=880071 RepID=I4AG25_BERLS|nr:TonB-dependent receptor [Bernardetia litoralis]AFM02910.1 hypothetical protein Fleli_0434 [Bernardetia litoralis DSM 6794]
MKKYLLFTLFLFSSSILMAQTATFEGKVIVKETDETIPFAQVILRTKTDSSLVAFSSADADGKFNITTTFGTYILEVRSVGYFPNNQLITIDKKKFELDIFLKEDVQALKQVEIVDRSPITQNNDTLSFNAADFSAAGDEKLEDIVKKIPNLEVNNNGEIFYKGKQIEDIEIEGESLFKQSPQTINRSLPADVVDKIQVIEGKSWDENPKLNIKIKEDKKNIVFGEFTVFGGINNQEKTAYCLQSNAFYINPKLKMMALADANNVGKHLFDLRSYLSFTGNSFSSVRKQNVKDLPLQQTSSEIPPQTETLFGGLSAVYTISKKFKLKSYSFYNQRKESYLSETIRDFTESSINGVYQNTQNQSQNKGFLSSEVSLLFSPSISQNLTTRVAFRSLTSSMQDKNEINFLDTQNSANQEIKLKNPEWNLSTLWTKTINTKNQINLSATYQYLQRNRGLDLQNTQDVFSNTFSRLMIDISSISLQNITTQTNQTNHNCELKGNFRRLLKEKTYLGIEIQSENQNQNQIFFSDKIETIDKLNPTSDYSIQRNSGSAFFELEKPKLQFRTWLTLAKYNYNFEGKINQIKVNEFQFEPKLDFSFMVASSQRINLSYQRKNEYPNKQNLNQVWYFENFRTLQNGTDSLAKMTTNEVRLGYNYTNLFNRLMIYGSLSYQKISNAIAQNQFIFAEANAQTDINAPKSIMTGLLYITKSFDVKEIPFSVKTQIVWNRLESQNFLNEIKNNFRNGFTKYQIDLNSHSKGIFNISFSTFFQQSNLNSSLNLSTISLNQYQFLINPVIQPTEKLNFSFSYEQLFYQNAEQTTTFSFLNAKATYRIFKRTNLKLEGYNLLNTSSIDFLSITPIYTQTLSRQILGRIILLGLNYNF